VHRRGAPHPRPLYTDPGPAKFGRRRGLIDDWGGVSPLTPDHVIPSVTGRTSPSSPRRPP
jgi:hypothetical protein